MRYRNLNLRMLGKTLRLPLKQPHYKVICLLQRISILYLSKFGTGQGFSVILQARNISGHRGLFLLLSSLAHKAGIASWKGVGHWDFSQWCCKG